MECKYNGMNAKEPDCYKESEKRWYCEYVVFIGNKKLCIRKNDDRKDCGTSVKDC